MSPNNYLIALTILIGSTLNCGHASGSSLSAFIVNGNEATEGAHPWQVSVQRLVKKNWHHVCGGALIGDRFALTASHCVYNKTKNENGTFDGYRLVDLRVVVGANKIAPLDLDGEIHQVQAAITPLGLNPFFDVALLKLQTPVNISRSDISPITIAQNADDVTGRECWVSGWGSTSPSSKRFTPILREAAMKLVQLKDCRTAGWRGISPYQTCATGNPRENTVCSGDSGGPLACSSDDGTPILMGISSFVYKQCETGRPNVFGKVSVYRNWLRRLTKITDL